MKRTTKIYRLNATDIERGIADNIAAGMIEVWGVNENGEPLYKVTPKGEARVHELIGDDE